MTIVCVRDGVLAVDSLVTAGSARSGTTTKWAEVHPYRGGGFVATAGAVGRTTRFLAAMREPSAALDLSDDNGALWLLPTGEVREWDMGDWISIEAPFHAIGSGDRFALGAMAHGATAEEAAHIACDLCTTCGGPVSVMRAEGA